MTAISTATGITGIDHAIVGVRDLDAARAVWSRLGFTLSPRGKHIGWGTANYCVMLERGYVELLGIVDSGQFTNNLDKFLATREGMMGVALGTDDAQSCLKNLGAAGFKAEGPKQLKRELELPGGTVLPEFSLLFLPPDKTPQMSAFICQHLTPDLVRRPEWLSHANGARRLVSITIASLDPVDAAFGYEPLFGADAVKVANGLTAIVHNGMALRFVAPSMLGSVFPGVDIPEQSKPPFIVGMKIEVADAARCREHLEMAGVQHLPMDRGCLVPPSMANGALIEFVMF